MKNAQAKIDALLDVLVENLQDEMIAVGTTSQIPEPFFVRLKELILLSNLNNAKQSKEPSAPGPQSKVPEISNEKLIEDLKKTRPDNFPRRGPRNGKRENVAPPVPAVEQPLCAVHEGVICNVSGAVDALTKETVLWLCPDCLKENPKTEFVSLKALL